MILRCWIKNLSIFLNNKKLVLDYKSKEYGNNSKKKHSLGLETFEVLGFNSEEELELEISKLIQIRPEFEKTQIKFI